MRKRWQLERAGLVNFWYYHDEAEFHLSQGRLILRGANGSGKSVTMQSFLPLVLDGDKRPWRLDPFGSKDRRVEYYLLLDENSGITDRTGYLYLEFYHPGQDRYLTVGIGLRARRNVPGVNFWGFVITDNRRIGQEILLYEQDFSQGNEVRIPISKNRLEEVIGSGGEVVTEPGKYKKLVNDHLFGFADPQAYQELLDLLIQLRSPKLSKDFKPSTIYEILTAALPALQDDELRPLSEVLEDMDQISDRLAELAVHRKEAEVLDRAYNMYNEFWLFAESNRLLNESKLWEEQKKKHRELETDMGNTELNIAAEEERLSNLQAGFRDARTELETLTQSEAVEKRAELDRLTNDETTTTGEISAANCRKSSWEKRRDRSQVEKGNLAAELAANRQEQSELIAGMETDARESEFHLHDFYHRQWEHELEARDNVWITWKSDMEAHVQKLNGALRMAREEDALKRRTQEAEADLSRAREIRDRAEGELLQAEQAWEESLRIQQQMIFTWRKELVRLPLSEEAFQNILHLLAAYPDVAYETVMAPVREAYLQVYEELLKERADWKNKKNDHLDKEKEIRRQWQEWKDHKEPEPLRSEARELSRNRRVAEGEQGVPFYAVCEFRQGLSEELKACLEAALDQAGLLDAWLCPAAGTVIKEDEEEVWVKANPDLLAHTLADYLYPTPPEDGCVSTEFIDRVLRTVRLGEGGDRAETALLTEKGSYCLGPLEGQAAKKERAEFIGKETRRLTRLAEMARLEELIKIEKAAVSECEKHLTVLSDSEHAMKEEIENFPPVDNLYHVYSQVESKRRAFGSAKEEEESRFHRYKEIQNKWLEVRGRLHEFMQSWSMPKTEQGVSAALEAARSYAGQYNELKSMWSSAQSLERSLAAAKRDWEEACEKVEEEKFYLEEKENLLRSIQTQIEVFTRLLQKMGIYDIHQQIRQLKERILEIEKDIEICRGKVGTLQVDFKVRQSEVTASLNILEERQNLFLTAKNSWLKEWNRKLTAGWQDETVGYGDGAQGLSAQTAGTVDTAVIRLAQRIRQQYRPKFEQKTREAITNGLYDAFYQIRQTLHEYSPEQITDPENGRMLVVFMRDRQNPITPKYLLDELQEAEEEQRQLLSEKDRELYEQIIIHSVGRAIKKKIFRAEEWVRQMNALMQRRDTSSGLKLWLKWEPRAAANEQELDTAQLVKLLKTDPNLLRDEQIEQMVSHFRSRIAWAKRESEEHKDTLRHWITQLLDYRKWFRFTLDYEKGEQSRRELTDSRFNVLSGGEKAMAMYIPLFAATYSRYSDSRGDSPKLISLDEAFAGVDDENLRDMFELLTQLDFDYIMTSQVLWGCYDTVPDLSIYELFRPKDASFVTLIRYHWNGYQRYLVDELVEVAASVTDSQEE